MDDEVQQLSVSRKKNTSILLKLIIVMEQHFVLSAVYGFFGVLNILFLANLSFIQTSYFLF